MILGRALPCEPLNKTRQERQTGSDRQLSIPQDGVRQDGRETDRVRQALWDKVRKHIQRDMVLFHWSIGRETLRNVSLSHWIVDFHCEE